MKIFLPDCVNEKSIYNDIIEELSLFYASSNKDDIPIISLVKTERIDASAITLLASIINIMCNFHKNSIYIEMVYRPRLLYFLNHIQFLGKLKSIKFIDYDNEYIGGFSDYIDKEYYEKNKFYIHYPVTEYLLYSREERKNYRDRLAEQLNYEVISQYMPIFNSYSLGDQVLDLVKISIRELISNAQCYSKSLCYVFCQCGIKVSNTIRKSIISIADIGVGLKKSLDCHKSDYFAYPLEYQQMFKSICLSISEYDRRVYEDLFVILECLYYSEINTYQMDQYDFGREVNLYILKGLIVNNNGIMRIHYKTTQVIFTYDQCKYCKKSILECIRCIIYFDKMNKNKTPIKRFKNSLVGVHINVEFYRGGQ
ncbi:hypothetical protein [Lacrimispora sp.]|uniref:hypothetical protein n=1 Tax=Lacrimispora sp. TaxID=2719234 RepID=UPI002FD9CC87